jgi:hypothetical protein
MVVHNALSRFRFTTLALLGGLFALCAVAAADADFDTYPRIRAELSAPACSASGHVCIDYDADDVLGITRLWISCRVVTTSTVRSHTEEVAKFSLPFVSDTNGTHKLELSKIDDLRAGNIVLVNVHASAYRGEGHEIECSLSHPLPLAIAGESELPGATDNNNESESFSIDRPIFPFRAQPSQAENKANAELSRVVNARRTDSKNVCEKLREREIDLILQLLRIATQKDSDDEAADKIRRELQSVQNWLITEHSKQRSISDAIQDSHLNNTARSD